MTRILLTGATGFLGSRIANSLYKNFNIIAIKRKSSNTYRLNDFIDNLTFINIEEVNLESIFENLNINVIIHCATNYGLHNNNLDDIYEANVYLPSQLLKLGIIYNCHCFINVDTFYDTNYGYLENYSKSKNEFRKILNFSQDMIKVINTKIGIVYGSGDNFNKFTMQIIIKLLNNQKSIDFTLGQQKRHFVYVDDAASAYNLILSNLSSFTQSYTNINIGNGLSTSIRAYVILISKIIGSTSLLNFGIIPYRNNEIMNPIGNFETLKNLGWTEQHSLITGLRRTINYVKYLND